MTPRPIRISSVVLLALLIFCWQSAAQNPGGSQPPGTTPGSGPYQAVMEMDPGLPDHTIYRPENLSALNGATLPIVVWGNGACVEILARHRPHIRAIRRPGELSLGPNSFDAGDDE